MDKTENKEIIKREEEEDIVEDISLIFGFSFTVSIITLLRNISVLINKNFWLAGNINLQQTQTDLWRYIFFIVNIICGSVLAVFIKKNKANKIKKYLKAFVMGFVIVIGIEIFFYFLHQRLL